MISIIVAVAEDRVIGGDNQLLWRISEDLKRFKTITSGHPVVMGRKTWESLGRPLPNRTNVVISRNTEYDAVGATVVSSLEQATKMFPESEEIFIIGGGEIYRQTIDTADRIYLTHVHNKYEGDTVFPEIDAQSWKIVSREFHERGEKYEYPFEFINFERYE